MPESYQPIPLKIVIYSLVVVLLWAGYHTIRWGVADYYASQSFSLMSRWDADYSLSMEEWQQAADLVQSALDLAPEHPSYHQRAGVLYRTKVTRKLVVVSEFNEVLQRAADHLRRSTELRPTWPSTWADLATVKVLANEFDKELDAALFNAVTYGPWEPDVHYPISTLGVRYFDNFNSQTQMLIIGNVTRGFRSASGHNASLHLKLLATEENLPPEMLDALVTMLHSSPWTSAKLRDHVRLTNWLWPRLSTENRSDIAVKATNRIQDISNGHLALGGVAAPGFKAQVCARLPRKEPFIAHCRRMGQ